MVSSNQLSESEADSAAAAQVDSIVDTYLEAVESAPDDSMVIALAGTYGHDLQVPDDTVISEEDFLEAKKELLSCLQIPHYPQRFQMF